MNNLFLKVENVAGESKDAGHGGWTDILSYHWGVTRAESGNKAAHHLNLTVQAMVDKSTPAIICMPQMAINFLKSNCLPVKPVDLRSSTTASPWKTSL